MSAGSAFCGDTVVGSISCFGFSFALQLPASVLSSSSHRQALAKFSEGVYRQRRRGVRTRAVTRDRAQALPAFDVVCKKIFTTADSLVSKLDPHVLHCYITKT
jgi:hypothetical protein